VLKARLADLPDQSPSAPLWPDLNVKALTGSRGDKLSSKFGRARPRLLPGVEGVDLHSLRRSYATALEEAMNAGGKVTPAVIASLILAGALYFTHATSISRAVVVATMVSSTVLLCIRRAVWRICVYRNYDRDIGTRNVLIIGMGPSGLAIRNHLRRIRRLGYTFKGFVLTPQEYDKSRHSLHSRCRPAARPSRHTRSAKGTGSQYP